MPLTTKRKKLLELSEKAISIERAIVDEEKRYQLALTEETETSTLIPIREKIKTLHRKVVIYSGAMEMLLTQYHATEGI